MSQARAPRIRAEDLPFARRVTAFAVLMVFEFFYGWSWNTVDVLRPQVREALHLTLTQAGSAYTAQGLGAFIGALTLGQLADRFGRRRMIFVLVIGYGAMAALGFLVRSYPLLLAQRFALGLFLGGNFPVIVATYLSLFQAAWRGKLASVGNGIYNLSIVALGAALSLSVAKADWRNLLLMGSLPALVLAPLLFLVPDDRRVAPWGTSDEDAPPATLGRLPVAGLFAPGLARLTVPLFFIVGLNFFAYQAFAGWVTSYLQQVRHFTSPQAGALIAWQFSGATLGSFFWGWFADRFGRRLSCLGFVGGAAIVAAYLGLLHDPNALRLGGFGWGFMIACSVAWGPWIAELYPTALRSTAMSIFNWGRLISMTAPLLTGALADRFGLSVAMSLSAVGFAVAAALWIRLPETLHRNTAPAR